MEAPSFPVEVNWNNMKEYLDGIVTLFTNSEKALVIKWRNTFLSSCCTNEHTKDVQQDNDNDSDNEIQYKFMLESLQSSARSLEYFYELQRSPTPSEQRLCQCSMDYLLQKNILELCVRILAHLNHFQILENKEVFKTFLELYKAVFILSELSDKFTTSMALVTTLKCLVMEQMCSCKMLHSREEKSNILSTQTKRIQNLIQVSLRIVLHILLKAGSLSFFVDSLSWKLALQEVIVTEQLKEDKFLAQITLILLVNAHKESKDSGEDVFSSEIFKKLLTELVEMIQISLDDPSHTVNEFTTVNYLSMLAALVSEDSMKLELWKDKNSLSILKQIMNEVNYPEEASKSSQILCSMLLHPEVLEENKSSDRESLIGYFKEIKDDPHCDEVKKNISTALWLLSREDSDRTSGGPPVFISYCNEDRDVVHKISKQLQAAGISCWIDAEQMRGSTVNAMAEGIENSRVVLLCMSPAYQKSYWGQMEACFAVNLRKPTIIPVVVQLRFKPHGWLAFIAGDKTYYEFSARRDFEKTLNELIVAIKTQMN